MIRALALASLFCLTAGCSPERGMPSEEVSRSEAIHATRLSLEAERDSNGGDWSMWHASLAPFRANLRARIASAKARWQEQPPAPSAWGPILEPLGEPPLFLCLAFSEMRHLFADPDLEAWVASRPALETVPAVSAWLRERGIDLILVPVPLMGDVYPELIAEHAPANGIVAPSIRRVLYELARRGVEVADPLPAMRKARSSGGKPLYRPADPHWAPRGQRVMAELLGQRLERYGFVAERRTQRPRYAIVRRHDRVPGVAYGSLSDEQKARIEPLLLAGWPVARAVSSPLNADDAAVVVIGDSFSQGFQDFLASSINQPVYSMAAGGQVCGAIVEFVRDPSLLTGRRVVVWVTNTGKLGMVDPLWRLPDLPERDGSTSVQRRP